MIDFPSFSLAGRVAVVTGASSGIGLAIAEAMAAAGASLVLVGRDRGRLAECERRVAARGARPHSAAVDVTAEGAPAAIVGAAIEAFGALNVLVHSAGVFYPQPFLETPLASFDEQWRVNVRAPYALTQAAVPHLRPGGSVIFLSSIAGHVGFQGAAAYCATKGAVELMTRALSLELAPQGIRVNAVAPGNVHSPMNDHLFESKEYEQRMISLTPCGRVGVVEDIAPAVVFLASEAARYLHGTSLLVDGGWAAQ